MAKKFWWMINLQVWLARHGVKYYEPMLKFASPCLNEDGGKNDKTSKKS